MMTDDFLMEILSKYEIYHFNITFLRHSENRTYKVSDSTQGKEYLLRIHQPVTVNMSGLQHTYKGLLSELELLEEIALQTDLITQRPIRNRDNDLITKIEHGEEIIYCSLLTWIKGEVLQKEHVSDEKLVAHLGAKTAELHRFFRSYGKMDGNSRPSHGIDRHNHMLGQIQRGVELGLILPSDFRVIQETIQFINSRLEGRVRSKDDWGIIHGDINKSNIIVSDKGEISFIDFGLSGFGYYLLDVSMGALMVQSEQRDCYLEGYYNNDRMSENELVIIEGFMLVAILGYYAFHMENEAVHSWIRERAPLLCAKHCRPFLSGKSIFYNL